MPALYDKLAFDGDAEDYLHHTYVLERNGKCVAISFRENSHHPMSGHNFDDAKIMPSFEKIVQSIRFL